MSRTCPMIALKARWLVTADPSAGTVRDAVVTVAGAVLQYAGPATHAPPLPQDARVIDLSRHILCPGLVNAHTHLPMTLLRGLADDLPLQEWLEEHIFPAEARVMTPERVAAGAQLGLAEGLLAGTTCWGDGYFHEAQVLRAAADLGVRGRFAQGIIDFPAPGIGNPEDRFAVLREVLNTHSDSKLQRPAVFAHSPYTCSRETLQTAKDIARQAGCRFFIHVAETALERETSLREHNGQSPVAYLDSLGALDAETTLVHAIHVDEHDLDTIAERGCAVVVNPESNMKLASGIAPVPDYLARGVPVGLGTDGAASNNDLNLLGELGTGARLHKLAAGDPTALTAATALALATQGGADALGLGDTIGSVTPGKAADLIALRVDRPHAHPLYDPVSHIAYAASPADVDLVMIDGVMKVRDSRIEAVSLPDILARARTCIEAFRREAPALSAR